MNKSYLVQWGYQNPHDCYLSVGGLPVHEGRVRDLQEHPHGNCVSLCSEHDSGEKSHHCSGSTIHSLSHPNKTVTLHEWNRTQQHRNPSEPTSLWNTGGTQVAPGFCGRWGLSLEAVWSAAAPEALAGRCFCQSKSATHD